MLAYEPKAMYLMHYSRVTDVPRLGARPEGSGAGSSRRSPCEMRSAPDPKAAIVAEMRALWLRLVREHGCMLSEARIDDVLGQDIDLNAQGLVVWVERQRRAH